MKRREFLGAAALGAWTALLSRLGLAGTGGFDDYRAIVCVFLFGGNDSLNMIVPLDARYDDYAVARGGSLAIPRASILPLAGAAAGLHPGMQALQPLYADGRLAIVANVGTLSQPVTKESYLAHTADLPPGLGAHDVQQQVWQAGRLGTPDTGWAGRLADAVGPSGLLPTCLSIGGVNLLQVGAASRALQLDPAGASDLIYPKYGEEIRAALTRIARRSALEGDNVFERTYAQTFEHARETQALVRDALAGIAPISTPFPNSHLGTQLAMVSKLIAARQKLGARRQIFFVQDGGYDTHDDQDGQHPRLLGNLANSIAAFQGALVEIGAAEEVAGFTASDFGRRIDGNGDGTDHGWGAHHFVFGGAVRGGQVFGELPELAASGSEVVDGMLLPRYSVEQYVAPICRWFGVDETALTSQVLPNLSRFDSGSLALFG